jgi:prepilin-type N-terminal cleavage/methylation domain-containing protein/prepilin-type processing-associated H-X9-DG protein
LVDLREIIVNHLGSVGAAQKARQSMHCQLKRRNSEHEGFTLIELLVVVAIIAILAGLLFPAFGRMQVLTDRSKCASNLRQVGAAINAYVGDHDGLLPGPLWTWQNPWYKAPDYGGLGYHLAKYLKLNLLDQAQRADVLMCSAWQRGSPYAEDDHFICYVMNSRVNVAPCGSTGKEINPWGDAEIRAQNGDKPKSDPFAGDKPQPLASLPSMDNDNPPHSISASTIWAMQDYDEKSSAACRNGTRDCYVGSTCPPLPKNGLFKSVVDKPVHKDVRNTLFFDFHVEAIKVPDK